MTAALSTAEFPARQVFHFSPRIVFSSDFDSGNLARVERDEGSPGASGYAGTFNIWTLRDNESGERPGKCDSWFYFSVRGLEADSRIRINLVKFKQKNLFNQGWVPVFRTTQSQSKTFSRLRDKPKLRMDSELGYQVLTFEFKITSSNQTTWFAFAYPHSYERCQRRLAELEKQFSAAQPKGLLSDNPAPQFRPATKGSSTQAAKTASSANLYFHREPLIMTRDGRRVDLLTVSSYRGITTEEEPRLSGLFPDSDVARAKRFTGKRIVFISSRVHPGETPASHVFNGFIEFILRSDDARAAKLRDMFVFKLIPMLNPDGVGRGHFRVDTRGVNLNRVYILPNIECHPSIYAARQVMLFHHCVATHQDSCPLSQLSREQIQEAFMQFDTALSASQLEHDDHGQDVHIPSNEIQQPTLPKCTCEFSEPIHRPDGLVLYTDLHAHSNRQGCFIFGNHFADPRKQMFSELFPKLCSLNSPYFDFHQCIFSERNMRTKEGSGRVAMYRATNLVHCYTLECHYATGKSANRVAKLAGDCGRTSPSSLSTFSPLYDVKHYEQVGRALGVSLLDLAGDNPWSRLGQQSPAIHLPRMKSNMISAIQLKRAEMAKRASKTAAGGDNDDSDSDVGDGGGEGGCPSQHRFTAPETVSKASLSTCKSSVPVPFSRHRTKPGASSDGAFYDRSLMIVGPFKASQLPSNLGLHSVRSKASPSQSLVDLDRQFACRMQLATPARVPTARMAPTASVHVPSGSTLPVPRSQGACRHPHQGGVTSRAAEHLSLPNAVKGAGFKCPPCPDQRSVLAKPHKGTATRRPQHTGRGRGNVCRGLTSKLSVGFISVPTTHIPLTQSSTNLSRPLDVRRGVLTQQRPLSAPKKAVGRKF